MSEYFNFSRHNVSAVCGIAGIGAVGHRHTMSRRLHHLAMLLTSRHGHDNRVLVEHLRRIRRLDDCHHVDVEALDATRRRLTSVLLGRRHWRRSLAAARHQFYPVYLQGSRGGALLATSTRYGGVVGCWIRLDDRHNVVAVVVMMVVVVVRRRRLLLARIVQALVRQIAEAERRVSAVVLVTTGV